MTQKFHLHEGIAVVVLVAATLTTVAASAATVVNVANVEQLYDAVNNVDNVGATVVLAPGIYSLSSNDQFGKARPNGGRLELQQDMSLYGVAGDRAAVVIDASRPLSPSFTDGLPAGQRTGVIRIGRGSNTIEWLTVLGKPDAAAGIETDLGGNSSTRISVAHVISNGSSRGVDVRNAGFANNVGRRIDAEIVDNEFIGPMQVRGMSEGIRLANFVVGPDGGAIVATLRGNSVHGFQIGCIVANNRSSNASVQVRSFHDRFFANDVGCAIYGGLTQQATPVADSNSTLFEAFASAFVDNTATISGIDDLGGILVVGGQAATPGTTSHNSVTVSLWGCRVADNMNPERIPPGIDFLAFGARSGDPSGIAGVDNHVTIELHGLSKEIDVLREGSVPDDPLGSNTVAVIRSPDTP